MPVAERFWERWARVEAFHERVQNPLELIALCEATWGAKSFLEIGSKRGGTLWCVAAHMAKGALVVSVDLHHPPFYPDLSAIADDLRGEGFDVHTIRGYSQSVTTQAAVEALGPFEWVFIDGNHTRECAENDWARYGSKATKACAFHDIAWDGNSRPFHGCGEVFKELAKSYTHDVIVVDPAEQMGIGIIWK